MKKILFFSLLALICAFLSAQAPIASKIKTYTNVAQGVWQAFNTTSSGSHLDTLKSGDTLMYVFQVTHYNTATGKVNVDKKKCYPYLYQKFGIAAADTAVDIAFYTSIDGTNWVALTAGSSPSAWTTTRAKAATWAEINGWSGAAWFVGDYFAERLICKTKTGCKLVPYGYFGTIIY